ncbi:transcription factor TGAL1-like isoform X1 [Castanea sativa]|uniref:transcription factor TGAL1-like isoform X1 n=1 Tax=Castanea sativa TaxID=21020 RepID=UPI003F6515D3
MKGQICTEGNTTHSFRISDFGVFDQAVGFRLEDAVNVSENTVFSSTKVSGQAVSSDPLHLYTSDKSPTSLDINPSTFRVERQRLPLEKGHPSNLVSVSSGNIENWEESAMADASPRTDISTDVETDDKNQRFDRSQSIANVASDSSDISKDKSDQKVTLRRLAQNREAARKSRLRKKAYVQQLESSRLKLTQLEQELQRARQQGIFISSSGDQAHSMSGNGVRKQSLPAM